MHCNIKNLFKVNPQHLALLMVAKQAGNKDLTLEIVKLLPDELELDELIKKDYLKIIKGKKGQELPERIRLGKAGTKYLSSLSDPEVEDNDIKMFEYLTKIYLEHEDEERHIGNKKKVLEYCAEFRQLLNLDVYQMYWLCWFFLQEHTFTKKLEYIFLRYKKGEPYRLFRNSLHDSDLYQFYDTRKKEVEQLWSKKIT